MKRAIELLFQYEALLDLREKTNKYGILGTPTVASRKTWGVHMKNCENLNLSICQIALFNSIMDDSFFKGHPEGIFQRCKELKREVIVISDKNKVWTLPVVYQIKKERIGKVSYIKDLIWAGVDTEQYGFVGLYNPNKTTFSQIVKDIDFYLEWV